jgi:hypothetical protein
MVEWRRIVLGGTGGHTVAQTIVIAGLHHDIHSALWERASTDTRGLCISLTLGVLGLALLRSQFSSPCCLTIPNELHPLFRTTFLVGLVGLQNHFIAFPSATQLLDLRELQAEIVGVLSQKRLERELFRGLLDTSRPLLRLHRNSCGSNLRQEAHP